MGVVLQARRTPPLTGRIQNRRLQPVLKVDEPQLAVVAAVEGAVLCQHDRVSEPATESLG